MLPEQDLGQVPWAEVAVDLIGTWTIKIKGRATQEVFTPPIIDTASNLVKLVQIDNKTIENIKMMFLNTWLSIYLQLEHVIHNMNFKACLKC
jgi:hypothetical protein